MLRVVATLLAATAQVFRNSLQARLSEKVGTLGGTQVRFVYGVPFAVLFLLLLLVATGAGLPEIPIEALGWATLGAVSQIAATFLMLVTMRRAGFGLAYIYIKTEPVTAGLLGLALIGDRLPALGWVAVVIVTLGVIIASIRPGDAGRLISERASIFAGIGGGALFGLSAIAFRGAIQAIPEADYFLRAITILAVSLSIQSAILLVWFAFRNREAFFGPLREWRLSVTAGFLGALASAGWFVGFSLTAAANVRTLALIEMPLVALVSRWMHGTWARPTEWAGYVLITLGVGLLLFAEAA